ncbi:MAG TPA: flagellar motor switch protein FliN [Terriglobales bacterium]|nr:flagellar motor switch protein FliN [Terriglobales bacterium]
MTNSDPQPTLQAAYAAAWAAALAQVLAACSGAAVDAELLAPEHADAQAAAGGFWLRWRVRGAWQGEQAMALSAADAVVLAQLAAHQPADRQAELNAGHAEKLAQWAQELAAAARAQLSALGAVEFEFAGTQALAAHAASFACRCAGEGLPPLSLAVALDASLAEALRGPAAPPAAAPLAAPPAAAAPAPAADAEPALAPPGEPKAPPAAGTANPIDAELEPDFSAPRRAPEGNLDLLLDVPLDVSLRFGGRQMVLKDILELGPGAVIELDRGVQDPVELLVAGRVVAHGEVVILDGNYGLRVTEIASPRHRLSTFGSPFLK